MYKYKVLAFFVVLFYFAQSFFLSYGGISADSLSYFGIASDFPIWKTNLFPPLYPLLLRFCYFWVDDYFWAYKILSILLVIILLVFSYVKQFYFKETVLLFTGKSLFMALNGANSESLFVVILYFQLYFIHQFRVNKISSKTFILPSSLLMVLLVTTRYSGVFVGLAFWFYCFWLMKNKEKKEQVKGFFYFLTLSFIGIGLYLALNYYQFGSFTGEKIRGSRGELFTIYLLRDLLGVSNVVDPFIGIKPSSNSWASLGFQLLLSVVDIFLVTKFIQWYKRNRTVFQGDFHIVLWIITFVYTISVLTTGFFQQIEEMNVRMLMAANFAFFFSVLIVYFQKYNNDRKLFALSSFFLLFLMIYSLKDFDWFLGYKKQLSPQTKTFVQKKYLYNNQKNILTTTLYRVLFTQKNLSLPTYQPTNWRIETNHNWNH